MASGTFYSDWVFGDGSYRIAVSWSESNKSNANNKSRVTASVGFVAGWEIGIGSRTPTISINGNSNTVSFGGASGTGTFWSTSRYVDVTHDSNGSKRINISASFFVNATITGAGYIGTLTASATVDLDTLDRASPTITITASPASTSSISLEASAKVGNTATNCNNWQYKVDNGSWVVYSTTDASSSTKTITGLTSGTHSVQVWASRTANDIGAYSNTISDIDLVAPVISFTISNITTDGATISATSDVNCNSWEYTLDGGTTWTVFSTTSSKSKSVTISGQDINTQYTVSVRARKTSNNLYGDTEPQSYTTLGNTFLNSVFDFYPDDSSAASITFNWTVNVASYHHKLEIKDGSTVLLTVNNLTGAAETANKTIDISASVRTAMLNAIPSNNKSYNLIMSLETYQSYSGGTYSGKIGSASTIALLVRTTQANSGPTLSCSVTDTNATTVALTGNSSKLILNASNAQCVLTASARNGATISTRTINDISTTSYTYNAVAISSFVFRIRDSRGYEVVQTINPTCINYMLPTCVVNSSRVIPVSTNQVTLDITGRFFNGKFNDPNNQNALTVKYRYKERSSSTWSADITISNSDITTTATAYTTNSGLESAAVFDYTKTYDLRIVVADSITTVITDTVIAKGMPVFDFSNDDISFNVDLSIKGIDFTIEDEEYIELVGSLATRFNANTDYDVGDFVIRNGLYYECVVGGIHEWNAENWTFIAEEG